MDRTLILLSLLTLVGMLVLGVGVIYSRAHWLAKVVLIVVAGLSTAFGFIAYRDSLGYAVRLDQVPERFAFQGGYVREPQPMKSDPGAVFLLVLEPGAPAPRLIQLSYTKERHRKVIEAKRESATGKTVQMGRATPKDGEAAKGGKASKSGNGQKGEAKGGSRGSAAQGRSSKGSTGDSAVDGGEGDFDFKPPETTYPDKDGESLVGE